MEKFKDIKGYEGLYQISNLGRVKSLRKEQLLQKSGGIRVRDEKILSQQKHYKGYLTLKLSKENKQKRYKVHRLVAIAFIPNNENKLQVNHIDGVKSNNKAENLEWCTNLENQKHAAKTGLKKKKLKREDIIKIRKDKRLQKEIAKDYGVVFQTISDIKNKKTWAHV